MASGGGEGKGQIQQRFDEYFRRERCDADHVLEEERKKIDEGRPDELRGKAHWALAHSGGGIRSASFSIGVQQALQANGLMDELDYLSTVSGGGYAGSALTWALERADQEVSAEESADKRVDWGREFPFGTDWVGEEGPGRWRNRFLDYLRHHSRYLTPGSGLSPLSFFGSVLQGTVVSVLVYGGLALGLMVLLYQAQFFQSPEIVRNWEVWRWFIAEVEAIPNPVAITASVGAFALLLFAVARGMLVLSFLTSGLVLLGAASVLKEWGPWAALVNWLWDFPNWPALFTAALALLLVVIAVLNSVRTWISASGSTRYGWMLNNQRWVGWIWSVLLLVAWLAAAEGVGNWIMEGVIRGTHPWTAALPVLAAAGSLFSGYGQFRAQQRAPRGAAQGSGGGGLRLALGIFGLLFAVTMGAYIVAALPSQLCYDAVRGGAPFAECVADDGPISSFRWGFGILFGAVLLGTMVNVNFAGPHAVYRARLMEAFLPNTEALEGGRWEPATAADVAPLEEMARRHIRPLHLINANLILTDSRRARFRGRGGDCFIMSPFFSGSSATGWFDTALLNRSVFSREGMTLATAMAISGAALNPDSGVGGQGPTRGRAASLLLTFLNLRLGVWLPHPRRKKALFPPSFLSPGIWGGLLGKGLGEDASFLQLSDGGHFENLALYELIRRRAEVIIVTDGGADPEFNFADLANLMERARVDFGAQIEFRGDRPLADLVPRPVEDGFGFPVARRGWAVADLWYSTGKGEGAHVEDRPDREPDGVLFYIKTTLVGDLPADLVGYKKANATFPDETTADQFFDEPQFEAYRELGYQLGHRMVHEELLKERALERRSRGKAGEAPPEVSDPFG